MKFWLKSVMAFMAAFSIMLVSCSEDVPSSGSGDGSGEEQGGESSNTTGGYGDLGNNLITIGSTRDVTYTSCVLLGTVDFPKITSDHSYGVVFMEALMNPDFDYDIKLAVGGHSGKNDKEEYDCITAQVTSSASDGRFEKQLVELKPDTRYYYRAYVRIGENVNYSNVEYFTTKNPTPEINMSTGSASDIFAVAATMNGTVNIGYLKDVNEDQHHGFVFTTDPKLNDPEKLTYEYYKQWLINHYETEDPVLEPMQVETTENMNGKISIEVSHLVPGTTYYYRSFFSWNGKYFYSPDVKSVTTLGLTDISVGTDKASGITQNSATLNATVPFSNIGLDVVKAGFMISKKYSIASEFNREEAQPWGDSRYYSDADVFYVEKNITTKDYSMDITELEPETTYYVCGYICLGNYNLDYTHPDAKPEPLYVKSQRVQEFKTLAW